MQKMRIHSRRKWTAGASSALGLIWLCFAQAGAAHAQSATVAPETAVNLRLLSAREGRSIVSAAMEQDQIASGANDCSHVVHQVYTDAGFEYPYASSFELYAGSENFARVRHPQPGDLIAWPGHVGIVLEPAEHSFYSLVSTGLEAQNYEGPYWKSRGAPRFYRYKIESGVMATAAAKDPASSRASNAGRQQNTGTLIDGRSTADNTSSERPPKTASTAAHELPDRPTAKVANAKFEVARSIVISAKNKQPTKSEVAQGISELSSGSGSVLRENDLAKLALPVVFYEGLQVERLELKRDHGWAYLLMDSLAILADGETDYTRRREKVLWELCRTASGWEAITPKDRTYVPQDVAVRNLAAQLASETEAESSPTEREAVLRRELQLAKLISGLLDRD
jgi:hypothetical protein